MSRSVEKDAILARLEGHDLHASICECALGPHVVLECECGTIYTNAHLAEVLTISPASMDGGA